MDKLSSFVFVACLKVIFLKLSWLSLVAVLFFPLLTSAQLPTAFQKVELLTGLKNSVNFEFAPDGRIFILDRYGKVIIYKPNTQTTVEAATLDVFHSLEDGLLAIAFDPNFLTNKYIYLHHSPSSTSVNRVSRFQMNGDLIDLSSEVVVLEWPTQRQCCFHAAGDMDFDSKGNLYIATGDNSNHSAYATLNETDPNQSSENTSSNTNDLRGKILRIKPQANGTYTIPEGNLFPGGVEGRPEIYVMGARNPYKIFVDKANSDWLFWAEVGPDANVASDLGPEGKDEINLVKKAGNYGWPYFGGKNEPYLNTYAAPNFYYDPNNPVNLSKWNTGATYLPPAVPSWLDFFHECYLAGPRYYYNPSVVNPKKLPVQFDSAFFYYDFNNSKVWAVKMDENGGVRSTEQMAPSVVTGSGFIDLKVGPDGQLYILEYGAGCCSTNTGTGKLVRIDYIGIDPNRTPQVNISANKTSGSLPLSVSFSSEGTFDLDGDALTYAWDFESDGVVDSNSKNPSFTYNQAGTFQAQLRVDDLKGGVSAKSVIIYAGNNSATFDFVYPPDGGMMAWGDDMNFHVVVNDQEDGSTADGTIDCSALSLTPSFGHLNHSHDGLALHQCEGTYHLDATGHDTDGQDDIFMVFNANYTDAGGLTSFDQVIVHPRLMEAEFYDTESYTHQVDNTDQLGGGNHAVRALAHGAYIMYSGRNLQGINSVVYRVASNTGGTIEIRADSPGGALLSIAQVPVTGGLSSWVNVQVPVTNPGGKHDLYLVFKKSAGDVNLFDLNYVEFKGTGVSTDNTPAKINTIQALSQNQVSIKYNEPVKKASAEQLSNYALSPGITITSALLSEDRRTLTLTTSNLLPQVNYSLTVSNIENEAGVVLTQNIVVNFLYKDALFRINSGGNAMRVNEVDWEQDGYHNGNKTSSITSLAISNTTSDEIYWTERYGNFSYNIPVPEDGYYNVALHFAEIYHGVKNSNGVGARIFNVSVEGGQFSLNNYDIIAKAGGPATAVIERITGINVTDGNLTVTLSSVKDYAKISAVEVSYGQAPLPTPSITIKSPVSGARVAQPFNVTFEVKNWEVGNGTSHIHKIVDGVVLGGVYTTDPITFSDLTLGNHTIKLELANSDHTASEYSDEITVNVQEEVACNDTPFPQQWTEKIIGNAVEYRSPYILAEDLDGDGFKDIVTGGWWYKNPGTPQGTWTRKLIGSPMNNMSLIHDFDGDGDYDIFGTQGQYISAEMAWAENDGKGNFTIHTNIPAGTSSWQETFMAGVAIGNFNGVANTQIAVVWNGAEGSKSWVQMLTVPADPKQPWTIASISPNSVGEAISAGDIDNDGDLDLFQGANWLRNEGNGTWTTFSTGITLATHFDRNALADLDGDGFLDGVVNQIGNDQDVSWFKPGSDPTKPWMKTTIGTGVDGGLSLDLVDIDFDGDIDVLTGEWKEAHRLLAYENDLCNSGTWIEHVLHPGGPIDHHDGAIAVDIDNDTDLDLLSMGWDQRIPRFYINNSSAGSNAAPVAANPIPGQIATAGTAYSFTFAQNTFSDPNGDAMSYTATLANGNPLPAWLSFNVNTRTFSGTSPQANIGLLTVRVVATDSKGASGNHDFSLVVKDVDAAAPYRINAGGAAITTTAGLIFSVDQYYSASNTVTKSVEINKTADDALYQSERYGKNFSYSIPVANGTYAVRLHFAEIYFLSAGQRVFNVTAEGTPVLTNYDILADVGFGTASVKWGQVSVSDGTLNIALSGSVDNAKVSAIEVIGISAGVNQLPVANAGPDKQVTLPASSVVLNGSGTDSDGSITAYSWNQVSGPNTAVFSSKTINEPTVSGLVAGTYTFSLTVTDNKTAVSPPDQVSVVVIDPNVNQVPVVSNAIPDQQASVGTAFSFTFDINTFTDGNGDVLTYTASQANNTALPSWLNFNAGTRTFSGTPPSGGSSSLTLKVTANDGKQGTVSDEFLLSVQDPSLVAYRINSGGGDISTSIGVFNADAYHSGGNVANKYSA
ncbi:malectin domain-containing carbohydrate-binding protein, partial [Cesiribacter sp. SM1]|uniref:malectin domain-containing carbohydrate-binding protein n=1 Tax=Cesiribacter sp. SM1 TaxID=2861196 RepID=UPI001CD747C4